MSCVTMIGRNVYFGPECDVPLTWTPIPWTRSKMNRLIAQAHDTAPVIRAIAAANPRLPGKELWFLIQDPDVGVRRAAIKNVNATLPMFEDRMLNDPDRGIKLFARMMWREEAIDG